MGALLPEPNLMYAGVLVWVGGCMDTWWDDEALCCFGWLFIGVLYFGLLYFRRIYFERNLNIFPE